MAGMMMAEMVEMLATMHGEGDGGGDGGGGGETVEVAMLMVALMVRR